MGQQRVESVERALTLLNTFSSRKQVFTLTELAQHTGFYKSTILRLSSSLERFGYLTRDTAGVYHLGPALARLGTLASDQHPDMETLIRPHLVQLRNRTRETASFSTRDGDTRICRFRETGTHELCHLVEEGSRYALDSGATAHMFDAPSDQLIHVSRGERTSSLAAVAVALRDQHGRHHGVLALTGLDERFDEETVTIYGDLLLQAADQLGAQLSHFQVPPR